MAISKSTPYVRYKENFTSNLHLGTIHVESEYLDRTQKTTIESIHGMTWHNKVVNENKELDLLSNLGFELTESKKEYFNVGEQRVSVDEIHGMQDIEPNEDGTYTYSVTSIEGEYAEIYDGLNNIISTSDGLDGNFEIVYDTDEEDITGSVVLDATMPNYTIEDSNVGELNNIVFKGETLVNILPQPSLRNKMENTSTQRLNEGHDEVVIADGEYKSAILKGQTLVNHFDLSKWGEQERITLVADGTSKRILLGELSTVKAGTKYLTIIPIYENTINKNFSIGGWNYYDSQPIISIADGTGIIKKIATTRNTDDRFHYGAYMELWGENTSGQITFGKPMLIEYQEGMENWDIPYFEGMQSVKMPALTTTGKNLWRYGELGEFGVKKIQVNIPKGTYFFSGEPTITYERLPVVLLTDSTKQKIAYDFINSAITADFDIAEVTLYSNGYHYAGSVDNLLTLNNFMMEQGGKRTTYEPYRTNILTTSEEVELRKVGNVQDELNLLTGELTQRVGEVVLDGSEDEEWLSTTDWKSDGDTIGFFITTIKNLGYKPNGDNPLDNHLTSDFARPYKSIATYDGEMTSFPDWFGIRILKSKLETPDVNGFKKYLKSNTLTVMLQLTTPIIKTIDLTVTDQDNVVLEIGKPYSYKDGHIQVQSSNGILPSSISYEVPSQNHIHVDMLKPSNTYTLKRNGANFEGSFFIDGTEYNTNVFMTSHELTNKSLIINDMSEQDKVAMFEGNYGTSTIPYFEGMCSVEMPVLQTTGKNLFDVSRHGSLTPQPTGDIQLNSAEWGKYNVKYILKPNTQYTLTILGDGTKCWIAIVVDGSSQSSNVETSYTKTFSTNSNGEVTIGIYANSDKYVGYSRKSISIEEGTVSTPYEPYKSNTLTINEPIQLRGIGDVKDEYNVETGELTQRIGEIVLDDSYAIDKLSDYDLTNTYIFALNLPNKKPGEGNGIVNIFKTMNGRDSLTITDVEGAWFSSGGNQMFIRISKTKLDTPDIVGFKKYLSRNEVRVQYELETESIKTVISTILDQDGKPTHSMHTYTGSTNLSTSSDALIPNVNLDYEISSSTGTVTGTSATIENGENGSPISAIVYGETLLNIANNSYIIKQEEGETIVIEENEDYEELYLKGLTSNSKSVVNPNIIITNQPLVFGKGGRL